MISNLTIRSNLIEGLTRPSEVQDRDQRMNAPLARISARDLDELGKLSPYPTYYFDTRNLERGTDGLPTPEQKVQWISYFFHGDETISMQEGQRCLRPWLETAATLRERWDVIESHLDEEMAIECLCVFESVKQCLADTADPAVTELFNWINAVSGGISEFLEIRGIHQSEQQSRVRRILGLSDW
jgi:hypothetical protein